MNWKKAKKKIDKVLNEMTSVLDLSDVTLEDILETCDVSHAEYNDALANMQKKTVHYLQTKTMRERYKSL